LGVQKEYFVTRGECELGLTNQGGTGLLNVTHGDVTTRWAPIISGVRSHCPRHGPRNGRDGIQASSIYFGK